MSELATAPEGIDETIPGDLVEIGIYGTPAEASAHGLVVLAMRQSYWTMPAPGGVRLLVDPAIAEAAREQLACFERESAGWPPVFRPEAAMRAFDLITPLLWSLLVLAIFRLQMIRPAVTAWGVLDTEKFFKGEWWRPATALFLHADGGHVVSNALSGIPIFASVSMTLGRWRGWILLGIASVLGNLAVAGANAGHAYQSLGASTMIFAGLGLLTGRSVRLAARMAHPHRWRSIFIPFAAGATILGLYGAGGLQIDVGAHLAGFLAGLALGCVAGVARAARRSPGFAV